MDLHEFLAYFDFDYDIVSPGGKHENRIRQELLEDGTLSADVLGNDLICLIDLQGAYLGGIGNERFPIEASSVQKIVDRMGIYVQESVYDEFTEALENRGVDLGPLSLEEMIEQCKALGVGSGEVCYELAEAVANPERIVISEVDGLEKGSDKEGLKSESTEKEDTPMAGENKAGYHERVLGNSCVVERLHSGFFRVICEDGRPDQVRAVGGRQLHVGDVGRTVYYSDGHSYGLVRFDADPAVEFDFKKAKENYPFGWKDEWPNGQASLEDKLDNAVQRSDVNCGKFEQVIGRGHSETKIWDCL